MRLFIGISIPPNIRECIDAYINENRGNTEGVKWVEKNNFHITLKFLGEVGGGKVPFISESLRAAAVGNAPFTVSLSSVGAFPSMKYPRVYWIGVEKGKDMVKNLHDDIERELVELGFPAEGKKFHPHVTIGRLRKFGKGSRVSNVQTSFGEFMAMDFCLYKSTITKKGSIYDIIEMIKLEE